MTAMGLRILLPLLLFYASAASPEDADVRQLLLRGRYAEAIEAAQALSATQPIEAALLQAEALLETGQDAQAYQLLVPLWERETDSVPVAREVALLTDRHWSSPDIAAEFVKRLLELEPDAIITHWLRAKRLLDAGQFDEAKAALAWFAEHRGDLKPDSADDALALAKGLVEHARWSREAKWFNVAVNEVLGDAEKKYPLDWRIPAARARLFAERHNEPAAVDSLNAALAKNGSAAELHALRARMAIEKFDLVGARRSLEQARRSNKRWPEIALVEADIAFAELQPQRGLEILEKANHDDTQYWQSGPEFVGRKLAAIEAMRREVPSSLILQTGGPQIHPIALVVKGEALDRMRRFSQAKDAYHAALNTQRKLPGVRGKLAQELLRLGQEEDGAKLMAEAQREDPFDVRVKNTLAVLDVLSTYATLETDHFIIRFDRGRDELLARYAADYLEKDVYPDLVKQFGHEPKGKSLIEIYNRSGNTSGHGWFSARMVGVPGLHTIGACAGKIVALASPTDMPRPYNWARVLRHEFVHLLNLEQTSFNVPHWVTEGLAVTAEDRPRPSAWTRLITQRYLDEELFTLENINFGFIRPSDSNDWTCAYAQAQIYIEFMLKTYGEKSVPKLLAAFADNLSTSEAIEAASGVSVQQFEQGYREYVAGLVKAWGLEASTASQNIDRLQEKLAADSDSADLLAALAAAHLAKGELPQARKYATDAARRSPKQPMAALVLATLVRSDDPQQAMRIAQSVFDPKSPHESLLLLLADLKLADKEYVLAEKLLLLGKKRFPSLDQWNLRLAKLYASQKDAQKLEPVLIELSQMQEDDASITAKLADLALARHDLAAAERWSKATLQIDLRHAAAHACQAQVLAAAGKEDVALQEWEAAVELDGKRPEWQLELARALIKSGDKDRAQGILEKLVETSPALPGLVEVAQELRQ
jgi:predicted Zn-dependent protease